MNNYAIMHARAEESYWYWKGLDPRLTEAQRVAIPENYRLAKVALEKAKAEIAYPTIEPDVDEDSDGDDWSPEDRVILTPQGRRELER